MAVNHRVAGSSPAGGANLRYKMEHIKLQSTDYDSLENEYFKQTELLVKSEHVSEGLSTIIFKEGVRVRKFIVSDSRFAYDFPNSHLTIWIKYFGRNYLAVVYYDQSYNIWRAPEACCDFLTNGTYDSINIEYRLSCLSPR